MSRYFISAGWPYMYDVPGLHNCVPMLFADVYARFLRLKGHEVYYLCGSDEHGSRVEFVARGYGKTPQDLVDEKVSSTLPLLNGLGLSFDQFGRTSDSRHRDFVQGFARRLLERRRVAWSDAEVAYCPQCGKYLSDRFILGRCPFCGETSFGGQCNNKKSCGRIIPRLDGGVCALCGGGYELRGRRHLLFPIARYRDAVLPHVGSDRHNQLAVTQRVEETFRDVPAVMLTRDTSWGIPVPGTREADQSIYSWMDSLLGKVSFLAWRGEGQEADYWKDDNTHRLYFLGMDGVAFYGVLLPSLLLAADSGYSVSNWKILPNEVLIYEGGVCSKSTGTGIWLQEALAVLPGDLWRFYIYYNYARAAQDADFHWDKFAHCVNTYLIEGLEKNVERVRAEALAGGTDRARIDRIWALLSEFETRQAFCELLDLIVDLQISRCTLMAALPLLSCFAPRVADWASRKLQGELPAGLSIVGCGKLDARELRGRYQTLVDERRGRQSLAEEITNMRADGLCVCPVSLGEQ